MAKVQEGQGQERNAMKGNNDDKALNGPLWKRMSLERCVSMKGRQKQEELSQSDG